MENTTKGLGQEQHQQLLFMMLIQQHEQIAGMGLGRIPNPVTNKMETDLQSAKYAIDTLVMLQAFTKGNITADMGEFLEQTVTRLRIEYARAVSDSKKKPDSGHGGGKGDGDKAGAPGTDKETDSSGGTENTDPA